MITTKNLTLSLLGITLLSFPFLLSVRTIDAHATMRIAVTDNASAKFTASPSDGSAPLRVQFEAALQQNMIYTLDFGDGSSSEPLTRAVCNAELCPTPETRLVIAQHTYGSAGTYTATLTDSNGPRASATIIVIGGL